MKVKDEFVAFLDGIEDFTPVLEAIGDIVLAEGEVSCTRCGRLLKNVHYIMGVPFGPVCVGRIKYFMEMTVDDLRDIAKSHEVDYKGLRKNDLVKVALVHDDHSEWTGNWNQRFEDVCSTYGWQRVVESRGLKNDNRIYLSKVTGGYVVSTIDAEGAIIDEYTTEKYDDGIDHYRVLRDQLVAAQQAEEA